MRLLLIWIGLIVYASSLVAQDTIRVTHYNLLNYGINISGCTSSNNNIDHKDQWLSLIVNYVRPDIFTVNELGIGPSSDPAVNANRILNRVLNLHGRNHFSAAGFTNIRGSNIVNMLYFNHNKFTLHSQSVVTSLTRDINLYRLYYNNWPGLAAGDTTFLTALVAHFKAGSTEADLARRANEASEVMAYLDSRNIRGNVMFLADFNMKSAYEQAFQTLTQYHEAIYRFHDPVNVPGNWFNNHLVAKYHTQSTRTVFHNCFIAGGLDDRFDMILLSRSLLLGDQGLRYVSGSYKVTGQDGHRLNESLISPANNSAPGTLIDALYNMSDHLPVSLQLVTRKLPPTPDAISDQGVRILFNNPVSNILNMQLFGLSGLANISIYAVSGTMVYSTQPGFIYDGIQLQINLSNLVQGIYIIRVESESNKPVNKMMIKIN